MDRGDGVPAAGAFPPTRASVVRASGDADPAVRSVALDRLAAAYWRPVYKHLRWKWRLPAEDAEDLTQELFARAVAQGTFARFDPAKGRFRGFVRLCADRLAANAREAAVRQKRGAGRTVAFDFAAAEAELGMRAASPELDAEQAFRQEWARSLFALALADLKAHCESTGRATQWRVFERYDLERTADGPDYAALAAELALPVTQVTNHLFWARRQLRERVLVRLAEITADEDEFRGEARELLGVDVAGAV